MREKTIIFIFILFLCQLVSGSEGPEIPINNWLMLGPLPLNNVESEILNKTVNILKFNHLQVKQLLPEQGKGVRWHTNHIVKWHVANNFFVTQNNKQLVFLAVYLETARWLKTSLMLKIGCPNAVFLDGKLIKTNKTADNVSVDLELLNGKHLLLIKVLVHADKEKKFIINASLKNKESFEKDPIFFDFSPKHRLTIENLLNQVFISKTQVSPDGKLAAVFLRKRKKGTKKSSSWMEILNVSNGKKIFTSENLGSVQDFQWLKDSNSFSFKKKDKEHSSLYIYNLKNHTQREILEGVRNFYSYWWSNNNRFLIYSIRSKKNEGKMKGYKFIKEIPDRAESPKFENKMFLYYPASGVTHQISKKKERFLYASISPDSKRVIFLRSDVDHKKRPYYKNTLFLFDIATFKKEKLLETYWIRNFIWSPDSKNLLLLGGPSAFKGLGKNLKKDVIPNDYDIQAYIFSLNTKKAIPITKKFKPSISSVFWHPVDKNIYLRVTDQSFVRIYRYSLKGKNFKQINTGIDVVNRISYAKSKKKAVFWGSSVATPHKLYKISLSSNESQVLKDYNREEFLNVKMGKVKNWDFKTDNGKTIIGRIYYPPDFKPSIKYPCIVYYYGGTSPVTRDFGGRYPKNWYAANGYIVYVLQPSGAVGFGQDFSAIHVNDWGRITSTEIITGVKKLLAAHPYINPERVGAIGASYGGFMTQVLGAKTDIFAALISHAGISALSSYWGIGDWGYSYSAVATAESFPWNRKDIYVGHSPLFMAERYKTPLLLLHGEIDNNVPTGESYQMFAALKLLGKDVALITFKGQRHWILEYNKRVQWMKTIIAWYDKYLKNQPEHWIHMYEK